MLSEFEPVLVCTVGPERSVIRLTQIGPRHCSDVGGEGAPTASGKHNACLSETTDTTTALREDWRPNCQTKKGNWV